MIRTPGQLASCEINRFVSINLASPQAWLAEPYVWVAIGSMAGLTLVRISAELRAAIDWWMTREKRWRRGTTNSQRRRQRRSLQRPRSD